VAEKKDFPLSLQLRATPFKPSPNLKSKEIHDF
jgi:hypothetical protein